MEPGKNRQDGFGKGFFHGFPGWTQHRLSFPVQEPMGFEFQDSYAAANISGRRSVPQAGLDGFSEFLCKWIMCLTTSKPSDELAELT